MYSKVIAIQSNDIQKAGILKFREKVNSFSKLGDKSALLGINANKLNGRANVSIFYKSVFQAVIKSSKISIEAELVSISGKKERIVKIYEGDQITGIPKAIWLLKDDGKHVIHDKEWEIFKSKTFYKKRMPIKVFRKKAAETNNVGDSVSIIGIPATDSGGKASASIFDNVDLMIRIKNERVSVLVEMIEIDGKKEHIAKIYDGDELKGKPKQIWLLKKGAKGLVRDKDWRIDTIGNKYSKRMHVSQFRRKVLELKNVGDKVAWEGIPTNLSKRGRSQVSLFDRHDCSYLMKNERLSVEVELIEINGKKELIAKIREGGKYSEPPKYYWILSKVGKKGKARCTRNHAISVTKKGNKYQLIHYKKYFRKNIALGALQFRIDKGLGISAASLLIGPYRDKPLFEAARRFKIELPSQNRLDEEYHLESYAASIQLPGNDKYKYSLKVKTEAQWIEILKSIKKGESLLGIREYKLNAIKSFFDGIIKKPIKEVLGSIKPKKLDKKKIERSSLAFLNARVESDAYQRIAVKMAVDKDTNTLIIQGGAGSGKTTTLVEIINQFVAMGKDVLVVSRSNKAVDNIVLRYKGPQLRVFSEKNRESIDSKSRKHRVWSEKAYKEKIDAIKRRNPGKGYVVGVTSDSLYSAPCTRNKKFSVVIIDEAGTVNENDTILAGVKAKEKLILGGDHKQLRTHISKKLYPNGRIPESIRKSGMELLWGKGLPQVFLARNYRNHPLVTILLRRLIYKGKMVPKPWTYMENDTMRVVDVPVRKGNNGNEIMFEDIDSLLIRVPSRRAHKYIVQSFYDLSSEEDNFKNRTMYANYQEAKQVLKEFDKFRKAGYPMNQIRVISGYNGQIALIQGLLVDRLVSNGMPEEDAWHIAKQTVLTTDKAQGSESEAMILSFVRSNGNPYKVGHMGDLHRLNVAISRGMERFILIGDKQTIQNARLTGRDREFSCFMKEIDAIKREFKDLYEDQLRRNVFTIREGISYFNSALSRKIEHKRYRMDKEVMKTMEMALKGRLEYELERDEFVMLEELHELVLDSLNGTIYEMNDVEKDRNEFWGLANDWPELLSFDDEKNIIYLKWLVDNNGAPAKIKLQ